MAFNSVSLRVPYLWPRLASWWGSCWALYLASRWARLRARISCARYGHVEYPIFGYGKLSLQCQHCRRQTPGWTWTVKGRRSNLLRFGVRG